MLELQRIDPVFWPMAGNLAMDGPEIASKKNKNDGLPIVFWKCPTVAAFPLPSAMESCHFSPRPPFPAAIRPIERGECLSVALCGTSPGGYGQPCDQLECFGASPPAPSGAGLTVHTTQGSTLRLRHYRFHCVWESRTLVRTGFAGSFSI